MFDYDKKSMKIILALADENTDKRNNKLSESLDIVKSEVSKKVALLSNDGVIVKNGSSELRLTEKGKKLAQSFSDRLRQVTAHLVYEGMDYDNARLNAFEIVMYCNDSYFEKFDVQAGEIVRLKELFSNREEISGEEVERNIKPGSYELPFAMYKSVVDDHNIMSMARAGFNDVCVVNINDEGGNVLLKVKKVEKKSAVKDRYMQASLSALEYYDGEKWISAFDKGIFVSIPLKAFSFLNIEGSNVINGILQGSVEIRVKVDGAVDHHGEPKTCFFTIFM